MPKTERVHMVLDYCDGPLKGIADFQGKPHVYERQFSETDDDWTDLFSLMEIDQLLLELATEVHEIFLKWQTEFYSGRTTLDSHPALPADRPRLDELNALIGNRLQIVPERSVIKHGSFSSKGVQWTSP